MTDGFRFYNSTEMDPDNSYQAPIFKFSLPGFYNPFNTNYTSNFNVTIYDKDDKVLYWWDPTNTTYALTSNGNLLTSN